MDEAAERGPGVEEAARRPRRRSSRTSRESCTRLRRSCGSAVLCLLSEGHLIIEDFPGVGKTMLAKALARSLDASFSRHPVHAGPAAVRRHGRQRLQPAGERVRVPARACVREHAARRRDQPRLAEDAGGAARVHAGEPGHDRRDDVRARPAVHGHGDPEPDRVRGHLPAARGAARPLHDAARRSATRRWRRRRRCSRSRRSEPPLEQLEPVSDAREIVDVAEAAKAIYVEESLNRYVVALLRHTRADERLYLGASPRSGIALLRVAKARALLAGRDYLVPDDVKAVAEPVLAHRLLSRPEARSMGLTPADLVREALDRTPVPGMTNGAAGWHCSSAPSSTSRPGRFGSRPLYPVAVGLLL